MRIIAIAALLVALIAVPAVAIELEEGATFDGGICWEADGTEGISAFDGQCITPADYDAIFSYENLSQIEDATSCRGVSDPDCTEVSIAESYGITPDDDPASDRPLGTSLVEPGTEVTFRQMVASAHAPHLPIAD